MGTPRTREHVLVHGDGAVGVADRLQTLRQLRPHRRTVQLGAALPHHLHDTSVKVDVLGRLVSFQKTSLVICGILSCCLHTAGSSSWELPCRTACAVDESTSSCVSYWPCGVPFVQDSLRGRLPVLLYCGLLTLQTQAISLRPAHRV